MKKNVSPLFVGTSVAVGIFAVLVCLAAVPEPDVANFPNLVVRTNLTLGGVAKSAWPAGGVVAFADLTGGPFDNAALSTVLTNYAQLDLGGSNLWGQVSGKATLSTTLAGYGITDAQPHSATLDHYAGTDTNSILTAIGGAAKASTLAGYGITDGMSTTPSLSEATNKFGTFDGDTAKFMSGDGTLRTPPGGGVTPTDYMSSVLTNGTDATTVRTLLGVSSNITDSGNSLVVRSNLLSGSYDRKAPNAVTETGGTFTVDFGSGNAAMNLTLTGAVTIACSGMSGTSLLEYLVNVANSQATNCVFTFPTYLKQLGVIGYQSAGKSGQLYFQFNPGWSTNVSYIQSQ